MRAPDDVCAVVLAAGLGTRLRPLTMLRPKALVPVGNMTLLDRTLERLAEVGLTGPDRVAVNTHWLAGQIAEHVDGQVRLSFEEEPLGTAGALGNLHGWIDGRAVLVLNADAYVAADAPEDLAALLSGWDGSRVRMHGVKAGLPDPFHGYNFAGASLLPAADVAALPDKPRELVRTTWRPAEQSGRLDVIPLPGRYLDCGTPADYLAANLHAAGGVNLFGDDVQVTGEAHGSVLGAGSRVDGAVRDCVLWPGAYVAPHENLHRVIRVGRDLTVPAA
ncbi:nucleotidyltransferase family protein [Catellatospora chokoriensis]|uniref:Mannose-1-phosphate guanylyltransferase n=1 Tax=Catellatospora chokoriensis TaxID=310353 RepID=A0A8J3K1T5_9ACTN|nr:sugar phosphate nucleotidyltransferase [Catellatospora chokoriensis]GIF86979.1 mannose-1-phosphate guanylyltransferase [Catellatospora chokoriensis]